MKKFEDWEIAKKSLRYGICCDDTYIRRYKYTNYKGIKFMVFKKVLQESIYKIEFSKFNNNLKVKIDDDEGNIRNISINDFINLKNTNEQQMFKMVEKFVNHLYYHIFNKHVPFEEAIKKLFSLNKNPFDIVIEYNKDGIGIDIPGMNKEDEIIKFDIAEIESLNSEKLDKIAKYLLKRE